MTGTVYGIDLGTTYSCVARVSDVDPDLAEILRNKDNEFVTPSVIVFDSESDRVVGRAAKNKSRIKPDHTSELFKRQMGSEEPTFSAFGTEYYPHELSSMVLRKLVGDIKDAHGEHVKDVVITVPAYFGQTQRNATKQAGELAELNVIGMVNEPTAAAIAYGASVDDAADPHTVLVYDLGGGTFDVTIVRVDPNAETRYEVITSDGNHELGGTDWDDAFVGFVVQQFLEQTPGASDPRFTPMDDQELRNQIEQAKRALTEASTTEVFVRSGADLGEVAVTREQFDEVTRDLLNETINRLRNALAAASKKGVDRVDKVLLVGGSSKMPRVASRLRDELGLEPEMREPDLAVAKGAALYGEMLRDMPVPPDPSGHRLEGDGDGPVRDVCPKGFGLAVIHGQTDKEIIDFIVSKDDALPAREEREYETRMDDQRTVTSALYEQVGSVQSEQPENNEKIIDFAIVDVPPGYRAGTQLDVTFMMDASGLIRIMAKHPGKEEPLVVEVNVGGAGPSIEESRDKLEGILVR
ncbi:MAG: Hsp70 family protein [Actinomycetota bacterium]|nr:Hsp70 family protein [Actinomycetota bacterium]